MVVQIHCECGYVARGDTDDAVVRLIQDHISLDHPDLLATVRPDDIRSWIEVVG
jgi:predicted small metal-binding protein